MAKATEISNVDVKGPAASAIPLVLNGRLNEMCQLRKRALDFSDPEGVHDMRVASRRLRSALRDFSPYLRRTKIKSTSEEIRRLADALGDVRDHDVALIALDQLVDKAPDEASEGIKLLMRDLEQLRQKERKTLIASLNYRDLVSLRSKLAETLESAVHIPRRGKREKRELLYRDIASRTIRERLRELRQFDLCLYNPMKSKPLHKMRIAAKRLRYAIELFAPCFEEPLSGYAKQVALLQTDLGELHDCDVWLESFAARMKKSKQLTDKERAGIIWLIGYFTKQRMRHFRAALERWHDWETKDFVGSLTAAIRKPKPPKPVQQVENNGAEPEVEVGVIDASAT